MAGYDYKSKRQVMIDLRQRLEYKSQAQLGRELGVCRTVVHHALNGSRKIPPSLARAMGYEPMTVYVRVEDDL